MTLQQWARLQDATRHIRIALNDINDIAEEIDDPEIGDLLTGAFQSITDDVESLEQMDRS